MVGTDRKMGMVMVHCIKDQLHNVVYSMGTDLTMGQITDFAPEIWKPGNSRILKLCMFLAR